VEERHCGGGKAVEEERLDFAFKEVEGYEGAGEGLEERWGVGENNIEERVDEEGAEVFQDEDEAP
ncbi:MAG: hypothetical protein Q9205_004367, partial [Flavoplaca limonia]